MYSSLKLTLGCLAISGAALLFTCCKNDKTGEAAAPVESEHLDFNKLAGHWIAIDFCARANQYGSVLAAMNNAHAPYTYAITFDPLHKDSVVCYNGFETWKLAMRINVDTVELKEARPGKSIFLIYEPTSRDITMFDGTTGATQMDRMLKSKAGGASGKIAFWAALNHNLLQGIFTNTRNTTQNKISFTPGGYIMNFPDYDKYEVCTGGDCFLTGDASDIITLSKSKVANSEKTFGFKYAKQNDTLYVYNLLPLGPDTKGAKLGTMAYQFSRVIPAPAPPKNEKKPTEAAPAQPGK